MKKLLIILIAAFFISCEKEDIVKENTAQNHYKVYYQSECHGTPVGFFHVSIEEWGKRKMRSNDGQGCWFYELKDMDGKLRFFRYHSFEKPCDAH